VLVFGGDEVYPYPPRTNTKRAPRSPTACLRGRARPDVFAIPAITTGTTAWWRSRARSAVRRGFAGGRTQQTRSYFALKLPANWWLMAIDLQLGAISKSSRCSTSEGRARMDDAANDHPVCPEPRWILEDAYPRHASYERGFEHTIPRGEVVQAQDQRVSHRRPAFLQAA
jgi:hypothetical protein